MEKKIAIASDHAGYELKEKVVEFLKSEGFDTEDYGTYNEESCDYPDYALTAAQAVADSKCDYGILICGTGIGMSIVANKVKGIKAANCCSIDMARLAREHNDANILTIGARLISFDEAKNIIITFLKSSFQHGRHTRRIEKIRKLTGL